MFVETGAPDQIDAVAGLQNRLQLARSAAAHKAEVATMGARHHFQDDARFAMPALPQDDSFVAPFHCASFDGFGGEIKRKPPADSAKVGRDSGQGESKMVAVENRRSVYVKYVSTGSAESRHLQTALT
jgi:hypothetical protein